MADRVELSIRERIVFLSGHPNIRHWRKDLTAEAVKFFAVYSYLIVYRPDTKPLQVVSILHGRRDVKEVLGNESLGEFRTSISHLEVKIPTLSQRSREGWGTQLGIVPKTKAASFSLTADG